MGTVDHGDHDAMIVSRPSTPDPPVRIADRAAVDRFLRSYHAKEFVRKTLEEISARVAATTAAADNAENPPCTDIEMAGPASTLNTPYRGVGSSTQATTPTPAPDIDHSAATMNAARFVAVADAAASNVVGTAANVVNVAGSAGAAPGSNIAGTAGAASGSNVAGAAAPAIARPAIANSGAALATDPPPPYTEQTVQPAAAHQPAAQAAAVRLSDVRPPQAANPLAARPSAAVAGPAAAHGSRSDLASGHSRRRHTRLAAAAAAAAAPSAREFRAGTACCPIIID